VPRKTAIITAKFDYLNEKFGVFSHVLVIFAEVQSKLTNSKNITFKESGRGI
jgi:hypothetical protein